MKKKRKPSSLNQSVKNERARKRSLKKNRSLLLKRKRQVS